MPSSLAGLLRIALASAAIVCTLSPVASAQKKSTHTTNEPASAERGSALFLKYCVSCHGDDAKGSGPAAKAMRTLPPDLTLLAARHDNQFPSGYVAAVLKFGKSITSHGSEDMPVWSAQFKALDPAHDPTGQHHVDDVVAYIRSIQLQLH